jgi:hypothetical protein
MIVRTLADAPPSSDVREKDELMLLLYVMA